MVSREDSGFIKNVGGVKEQLWMYPAPPALCKPQFKGFVSEVRMPRCVAALLVVLGQPVTAETYDFTQAARWQVFCKAEREFPAPFPLQDKSIALIWDRRAGVAEMDWPNGAKKTLRQLNSDAEFVAHFWYGPDTAMTVPEGQTRPVDCCSQGYLSFRAKGEFALTEHTVTGGGMQALSLEGNCDLTPLKD